ncbi:23250_t:CDS:2 [Rhizophagus irregularis]|nr:23250_t:CDS:2 [Rhizophagus irregularis]
MKAHDKTSSEDDIKKGYISTEELKSPLRQSKHHKTTIISIISLFAYHHLILASNQGNNMSPSDTIRLDTCINTRPYSTPELPWTEKGALCV